MLARNETIVKWLLYAAAAALCFGVQSAILQRITLWGVIPFLYPMIASIPSTTIPPVAATVFSLCIGIACDLLLPGSSPCFYTLVFPIVGLLASLLSDNLLPAGFTCSLLASLEAFLLTDGCRVLSLWLDGQSCSAALTIASRETIVTLPLLIPLTLLFQAVERRTRFDG